MALPFATMLSAGVPYYRITAPTFRTSSMSVNKKVVNGMGARTSRHGARYNYPGVLTVYLGEDVETVLAERMFYFQREVVQSLDALHLPAGSLPPFKQTFVLWEIELTKDVPDVLELSTLPAVGHHGLSPAVGHHGLFPSLMLNPSQDYWHLKDRRALIQSKGYKGLIAPSARSTMNGRMIVLFDDQSGNVKRIADYDATFELMRLNSPVGPFVSHVSDHLNFGAGSVHIRPPASARLGASVPASMAAYGTPGLLAFHR